MASLTNVSNGIVTDKHGTVTGFPLVDEYAKLGYVYDLRTLTARTFSLWSDEDIDNNTQVGNTLKEAGDANSIKEASFFKQGDHSDTLGKFGVENQLKLDVACCFGELKGAAKWLESSKNSDSKTREFVTYKAVKITKTTTLKEDIRNCKVNQKHISKGTHVITAVKYGTRAYFEFSSKLQTSEIKNRKSGEGSLEAKALKLFNAGGSHKRSNESNETSDSESFSSKFSSDDSNIKSPHCDSLEKAITFIKTDLVIGLKE